VCSTPAYSNGLLHTIHSPKTHIYNNCFFSYLFHPPPSTPRKIGPSSRVKDYMSMRGLNLMA